MRDLKAWQRQAIKKNMTEYRKALDNYYIKNKQIIELDGGYKAFSLLSPPIGAPVARRRIKLIMNNLIETTVKTPHFITMAITYDCQCKCAHCSAYDYQKEVERSNSRLKTPEIKNAVKQLIDIGASCIVFTGGEPFLNPDLFELVKSVDRNKSICTVFTNGEFLDEESVTRLKRAGAFGVFVSFDFADADKHDTNRKRKGLFEKAVRGIKMCQEKGILTGIATYVTNEKIKDGEMDAIMELGKKLNVLEVFIFDAIPVGKLNGQDCILEDASFDYIKEFRAKYNVLADYPRIIHQTMLTSISYPCTGEGCPAGIAHMHIRANGDVTPCDFTPFSFGNIRKETLKSIWAKMTGSDIYSKPSPKCRLSDLTEWEKLKNSNLQCISGEKAG